MSHGMVCNRSSIVKRRSTSGFTLAELLVTMPIGLLALAAACMLWAMASRTCASFLNYTELSNMSKNALDRMSQDIRNGRSVKSYSTNQIVIYAPGGQEISYTYDSNARTLTQIKDGEKTKLLTGCSACEFKVFTRAPLAGTNALNTAVKTNMMKVVQMVWTCDRKLTGDRQTTESQVSAKVVMRSQ